MRRSSRSRQANTRLSDLGALGSDFDNRERRINRRSRADRRENVQNNPLHADAIREQDRFSHVEAREYIEQNNPQQAAANREQNRISHFEAREYLEQNNPQQAAANRERNRISHQKSRYHRRTRLEQEMCNYSGHQPSYDMVDAL